MFDFNSLIDVSDKYRIQKPFYAKNKERKLVEIDNGLVLVKKFGERSKIQFVVNELKEFFGIEKMDMELKDECSYIRFFKNVEKFSVKKARILGKDIKKELARITVYDYVIGNNERFSSNLLFGDQYKKVYAIDEDDAFSYGKMDKEFYSPLYKAMKKDIDSFMPDVIGAIDSNFLQQFSILIDMFLLDKRYYSFSEIRYNYLLKNKKI